MRDILKDDVMPHNPNAQLIVIMISVKKGNLSGSLILSKMIRMSLVLGKMTSKLNQQAIANGQ